MVNRSLHEAIQSVIVETCLSAGYRASPEYRGKGWRADVLAEKGDARYAFEIQTSRQTAKKTDERQAKYLAEGITGCWLFEFPPKRKVAERPDLPLFQVLFRNDSTFGVSIADRADIGLRDFIQAFLARRIKFCQTVRSHPDQLVKLAFFEMECWKCKTKNHIYFVDSKIVSRCHVDLDPARIFFDAEMDDLPMDAYSLNLYPPIVKIAQEIVRSEEGKHLILGPIKKRFSKTIQENYVSFGCASCDALFGNFYVTDAQLDAANGFGIVASFERPLVLSKAIELPFPHWCYPEGYGFCDDGVGDAT